MYMTRVFTSIMTTPRMYNRGKGKTWDMEETLNRLLPWNTAGSHRARSNPDFGEAIEEKHKEFQRINEGIVFLFSLFPFSFSIMFGNTISQ